MGGTPPVRYLPCVVPCKLYFSKVKTTPAVGSVIKGNTIEVEVTAYQFGLQSVTGNGTIYL